MKHSASQEVLENDIQDILEEYAEQYGVPLGRGSVPRQLGRLLKGIKKATGKKVVVLIDEYDTPITDHLTNIELAERNREWLREFYRVFKPRGGDIRFFFMTGVSKFAKMSIFSALNLLKDVSLLPQFNDLLGFTVEEVERDFAPYLKETGQKLGLSQKELINKMLFWYDGYSWDGNNRVFNPYSMVNFFQDKVFKNYWFESGTPGFLIQLIEKRFAREQDNPPLLSEFEAIEATGGVFDSHNLKQLNLVSLLLQTGYLSIAASKNSHTEPLYTLAYPNNEVRLSLSGHLLSAFTKVDLNTGIYPMALKLKTALSEEDMDNFITLLRALFGGIPYQLLQDANESYYHSNIYVLLNVLGIEMIPESPTSRGRIDGLLKLPDKIYILEFKYGDSGTMDALLNQALRQIKKKGYAVPFRGSSKKDPLFGDRLFEQKR